MERGDLIEEEVALMEIIAEQDAFLVEDGVSDPRERLQIIYLGIILSMLEEPPKRT
jgi:hypothetical protein